MVFILSLNQESVDVCNYLADKIPIAVANINADTAKLLNVYKSISDDLGIHSDDFETMLLRTQKAVLLADEAIISSEIALRYTASKIEDYLKNSSSDDDSPKVMSLGRGKFSD